MVDWSISFYRLYSSSSSFLLQVGGITWLRKADGPTEVAAFLKACDFQDVSTNAWGLFLRTREFERLLKQRAVLLTWNPASFGEALLQSGVCKAQIVWGSRWFVGHFNSGPNQQLLCNVLLSMTPFCIFEAKLLKGLFERQVTRPLAQLRAPSNMMSRERPVLNCKRSNMFQHHGRKSHSHRVCRLRLLRSAPSSADLQRPWLKCFHKVWPDRARELVRLWTLDISRFCLYKTSFSTRTQ